MDEDGVDDWEKGGDCFELRLLEAWLDLRLGLGFANPVSRVPEARVVETSDREVAVRSLTDPTGRTCTLVAWRLVEW